MADVDKSKHIYAWWTNVDVEIHCYCGAYIQCSEEEVTKRCPNCGQKWSMKVVVKDIDA